MLNSDNSGSNPRVSRESSLALVRKLTVSAMFLAFAVVVKLFLSFTVPVFGGAGMKVSFGGVFTFFPAALFGPLWGGCVSGLADVLSYVFKPDGAYIPWLSLTAFLGGCIKGLIWQMLKKAASAGTKLRVVLLACLCLLGGFGISCHVSLINDGVTRGLIASQTSLPTRGEVDKMPLSGLSELTVSLAKYNTDTLTVKSAADAENIVLPDKVTLDGAAVKASKIGANAFSDCVSLRMVIIPPSYTKIDDTAFGGLDVSQITVEGEAGSEAETFAADNGMTFKALSADELAAAEASCDLTSGDLSGSGVTFSSSDTFRKYLAGYINFATFGCELIALLGCAYVVFDWLMAARARRSGRPEGGAYDFLRIFIAIFASGLIVTTINTEILKYFLSAWNGRAFMILWYPRAIEEMLVCLIQAYAISLLWGVYSSRIEKKTGTQ